MKKEEINKIIKDLATHWNLPEKTIKEKVFKNELKEKTKKENYRKRQEKIIRFPYYCFRCKEIFFSKLKLSKDEFVVCIKCGSDKILSYDEYDKKRT